MRTDYIPIKQAIELFETYKIDFNMQRDSFDFDNVDGVNIKIFRLICKTIPVYYSPVVRHQSLIYHINSKTINLYGCKKYNTNYMEKLIEIEPTLKGNLIESELGGGYYILFEHIDEYGANYTVLKGHDDKYIDISVDYKQFMELVRNLFVIDKFENYLTNIKDYISGWEKKLLPLFDQADELNEKLEGFEFYLDDEDSQWPPSEPYFSVNYLKRFEHEQNIEILDKSFGEYHADWPKYIKDLKAFLKTQKEKGNDS